MQDQLLVVWVDLKDVGFFLVAQEVDGRRRGLSQLSEDESGARLVEELAGCQPRCALVLRQGAVNAIQPLA